MKRTPIGCRPRRPEAAECLKKNLVCRTRFRGIGKRGSDKDGSLGSLALPRQARKRPPGAALDESWRESLGEACKRSAVAHCLAAMARPIKRARRLFPGDPSPRHGRDKGSAWRIEWNAGELFSERLDHGIDHRRVERVRRLEPPRADPACRYLAFERVDEPGRAGDHASVRGINGRNRKSSWQAPGKLLLAQHDGEHGAGRQLLHHRTAGGGNGERVIAAGSRPRLCHRAAVERLMLKRAGCASSVAWSRTAASGSLP